MTTYYLARHGDDLERQCWSAFLAVQWPSYERFWQRYVTPLTDRPTSVHFRSAADLRAIGLTDQDVCCAQLHYSILGNLSRTFQFRHVPQLTPDLLTEALARLVGAQDVAFELLERRRDPSAYDPWLESAGRKARTKWQEANDRPLQEVRDYRNHLVHGRLTPTVFVNEPYVPRLGRQAAYLDWREVTRGPASEEQVGLDLVPCRVVLDEAWFKTISHLEAEWVRNFP
jgi:hypothetical protein